MRVAYKSIQYLLTAGLQWFARVENAHRLTTERGFRTPSIPFLVDLAGQLSVAFNKKLTPTQAWALWRLVNEYAERQRTATQMDADIAHWFSVDPTKITIGQKVGLYANIGRVKAQEQLLAGSYDPTDFKAVYRLVLAATGDESLAQKAATDAAELLIEARTKRG